MNDDFAHTTLGNTGLKVHRLGMSATYLPGKKTIYKALDEGVNYFFAFGIDLQMMSVMRVSTVNQAIYQGWCYLNSTVRLI